MPYDRIEELPNNVRNALSKEAQEIFKEAFNNAWYQYKDPEKRKGDASQEEVANRVVLSVVKKKYKKKNKKKKKK